MRYAAQISAFAQAHRDEYLSDLATLVRIPSVSEEQLNASVDAPFGTPCVSVLDAMLALCRKYSLPTSKIANVIGMVEYGRGQRELDIVSHLDVQPAGDGWQTDPFVLTIDGDFAYGRGVSDDKGPALATLYALRAIVELGIPLQKKVRLVFGTGEEYGISDIHYYTDVQPAPPFMFTPDSKYPVVNTSKAGLTAMLTVGISDCQSPQIISIEGGENRGAVPNRCTAVIAGLDVCEVAGLALELEKQIDQPFEVTAAGDSIRIISHGVATHAIKADYGKNAVTAMLTLLCRLPFSPAPDVDCITRFASLFVHGDVWGRSSGLALQDEVCGPALYNVGILRYSPAGLEAHIRATLPASVDEIQATAVLRDAAAQRGFEMSGVQFNPGKHIPESDPYVQKLLQSYEHHTGQKGYGISAGGGNYSHYFPHGVAFGCEPPDVDTRMHGPGEFVHIDTMQTAICVFAQYILQICRSEERRLGQALRT